MRKRMKSRRCFYDKKCRHCRYSNYFRLTSRHKRHHKYDYNNYDDNDEIENRTVIKSAPGINLYEDFRKQYPEFNVLDNEKPSQQRLEPLIKGIKKKGSEKKGSEKEEGYYILRKQVVKPKEIRLHDDLITKNISTQNTKDLYFSKSDIYVLMTIIDVVENNSAKILSDFLNFDNEEDKKEKETKQSEKEELLKNKGEDEKFQMLDTMFQSQDFNNSAIFHDIL